ncbi:probable mediator of RNA polymerase II transcription subunit 26c isoform X2 [Durio zibethinus]|uniref:Probable mediator of RNA polymerase II transcription subunit 26c isoform X2 n=1 Tax=Durio zibethinus TaxID=66656 RepID=A0A6P6BCB1_DURZI|nr:probable mediator of RNA polymerase II transcription subunit 26c isoform X2 [Durio zibethinus]
MDLDDFRSVLETAEVDIWTFIDTAILVASLDYGQELQQRRDRIVERLYATSMVTRCRNCDFGEIPNDFEVKADMRRESNHEDKGRGVSPNTPQSDNVDDELDPYGGLFDDEQKRILEIKEHLEEPNQSEDSLIDLLQSLADLDITFQALKETDIGRHVNKLRKHSSNDVRRLVKQLVRKWKEIVDEWVKLNQPGELESSALMVDGDSPQQKLPQNGYHQVPDFTYSPNPHNGSSSSDKNNSEPQRKQKSVPPRKEAPRQREQKEINLDSERLASARKRLQENYKEAENAKRQRTIQVMDIHDLPKPKNAFFGKKKIGSSQGRHW